MKYLRRLLLRWKTRKWRPEDHDDCLSFMGPCNVCLDIIAAYRVEPPSARIHKDGR